MRLLPLMIWAGCACARAQSGIEVPSIGTIVDSSGAVRPVYGVAGSFWIGPPMGQTAIPFRPEGSVLLLPDAVLFATADHVVLRRRDGSELRFDLAGVKSIAALGPHYAAIHTRDSIYALRIDLGYESLFLLPGNAR